jgi:hypothetical protein
MSTSKYDHDIVQLVEFIAKASKGGRGARPLDRKFNQMELSAHTGIPLLRLMTILAPSSSWWKKYLCHWIEKNENGRPRDALALTYGRGDLMFPHGASLAHSKVTKAFKNFLDQHRFPWRSHRIWNEARDKVLDKLVAKHTGMKKP